MYYLIIILCIIATCLIYYGTKRVAYSDCDNPKPEDSKPEDKKLLSLTETTIAERQRYYNRGFRQQMQYDELQRRAESAGDTATLEAIRLGTYDGPLPILTEDFKSPIKVVVGSADDAPVQKLQYFCVKDKGYHVTVWPKDQYIGDYVEFNIAGITHGEHIDEHLGEFVATLVPDPTNPYDANAIKIMTDNGHRVGYVPRDTTATIRDFTTLPCQCYCFIGNNDGIYFSDCYITQKLTNVSPY
jgi:hypothetical protein